MNFFIICEIQFKFKTFGILVVDGASGYGAFVGAGFIGQCDISKIMQISNNQRGKSHQCGKRSMSVQVTLLIQGKHARIQSPSGMDTVFLGQSGSFYGFLKLRLWD